jgi:hypothetical protein
MPKGLDSGSVEATTSLVVGDGLLSAGNNESVAAIPAVMFWNVGQRDVLEDFLYANSPYV